METSPQPDGTLVGVALLGWMERERAIRFLLEDCVFEPGLTETAAESLWHEWRERAASIPERHASIPSEVPLSAAEEEYAGRFHQFLSEVVGVAGVRVIKTDPMQLVAMQHCIAIDQAAMYLGKFETEEGWIQAALPMNYTTPKLDMTFTRRNLDTDILIDLPHAEFIFGMHMNRANPDGTASDAGPQSQGTFGPKELLSHVTALQAGGRLMVGMGYHRLYARIAATEGSLPGRLSLMALDTITQAPAPEEKQDLLSDSLSDLRRAGLNTFGSRPALMADFFTEGLALPVYLRRKRYQLKVQARWLALDA